MTNTCTGDEADPFLFYTLATSAMLETSIEHYVSSLQMVFQGDSEVLQWLGCTWLREEATHGRSMQHVVSEMWPGFDWRGAFAQFERSYGPLCEVQHLRSSRTVECVARCITETQAAMMYLCLSRYVRDAGLREILRAMSRDEVNHYNYFRKVARRYEEREAIGFWSRMSGALTRSALVKGEDLAIAFESLSGFWSEPPPFSLLTYRQFLDRAREVIRVGFPFAEAERLLRQVLSPSNRLERLFAGGGIWLMRQAWT